jgi:putative ABC transport system substrate-binding protein
MRRREFVSLLASAAALWPIRASAQVPVVGFVNSSSAQAQEAVAAAYRRGLEESGFIEGKSVLIESRWANGQYSLLPELVGDLIERKVTVIMAGGPPAAIAAKKATSTIPVVFTSGDDPVQTGLVSSIDRPGGNLTGVYIFFSDVETKKLGLLARIGTKCSSDRRIDEPKFSNRQQSNARIA